MKNFGILIVFLYLFLTTTPTLAIEIGDIYYSNQSFSSAPINGLQAIGVVWQVTDDGKSGLIVALDQPGSKNWKRAQTYCRQYLTRGTKAGDWFMPTLLQMFPIDKMQNQRINNHTFLHINDKLLLLKEARPLKDGIYMTSSNDKNTVIGINLASGELTKLKTKERHNFRCMMAF